MEGRTGAPEGGGGGRWQRPVAVGEMGGIGEDRALCERLAGIWGGRRPPAGIRPLVEGPEAAKAWLEENAWIGAAATV